MPKQDVIRPYSQIAPELEQLAKEFYETPFLSPEGIVDHFGGLLHTASGGRLGRPSAATRLAVKFEEGMDSITAQFRAEMARLNADSTTE